MKFSIRLSIASLFLTLLVIISGIIISVTYFTIQKIMIDYAEDSLQKSSNLINSEILGYFNLFKENTRVSSALFDRGFIGFDKQETLKLYLIDLIATRPDISGAYLSDPKKNFYFVEKDEKGVLHAKIIDHNITPPVQLEAILDKTGKITSSKTTLNPTYDPTTRPYYISAAREGGFAWSPIYKFMLTPVGEIIWGVSASRPIYDNQGNLLAIFSIDTTIDILKQFITALKSTKNTYIYIMDEEKHVVSTSMTKNGDDLKKVYASMVLTLDDIKLPWVHKSLEIFNLTKQPFFRFKLNNEDYLASYKSIPDLFAGETIIGIVVPLNDIIGPLQKTLIICILIALFIVFLGAIGAHYLSNTISKPIVKLANDARSIAKLDIGEELKMKSYIQEVTDMHDAFNLMKSALRSFVRYVPFALVKQLIQSGEVAQVGGKSKNITLLFSDIKGFTTLSEPFEPYDLMQFLSEYFQAMSKLILNFHGTIDKYIGDGIMAFWGAPSADEQHAYHCCECALAMLKTLKEQNQKWKSQGKPELTIRIGINSADVVVGNVGSEDRLSYTAMGDGVNLASRLESLSKVYGTTVLVSESTYQLVKDNLALRFIDHVKVRGKTVGGRVYELLQEKNIFGKQLKTYNKSFEEAFKLYQQGKWDEALKKFESLAKQFPEDKLVPFYIERIALFKKEPPENWKGIWHIA